MLFGLHYNSSSDVFSFGIIMLEMALGRNHFAGDNQIDSIGAMMEVLGAAPESILQATENKNLYTSNLEYFLMKDYEFKMFMFFYRCNKFSDSTRDKTSSIKKTTEIFIGNCSFWSLKSHNCLSFVSKLFSGNNSFYFLILF